MLKRSGECVQNTKNALFMHCIAVRDGHFWQFLISIIDRFKKRLIE